MEVWEAHDTIGVKRLTTRADKLADLLGADHDLSVFEERLEKLDSPHPTRPPSPTILPDDGTICKTTR
jgi:hypothetical protein